MRVDEVLRLKKEMKIRDLKQKSTIDLIKIKMKFNELDYNWIMNQLNVLTATLAYFSTSMNNQSKKRKIEPNQQMRIKLT